MEISRHVTDTEPETLIQEKGRWQLCFNIKEKTVQGINVFHFNSCTLDNVADITRGIIIDTIVSEKYSKDEELALINNILNEPDDEDRKSEYRAYQDCRAYAKEEASKVMLEVNE